MKRAEIRIKQIESEMEAILNSHGVSSAKYFKRDSPKDYHRYKSLELEAEYMRKASRLDRELGDYSGQNETRGGVRTNAGRKRNTGLRTTTVRIPSMLVNPVTAFTEIFAEWVNREDPDFKVKRKVDEGERKRLLTLFDILKDFEEEKQRQKTD